MIEKLAFLEVVVEDFERALEWYTKTIGFEICGEIIENSDGRWCLLKTKDGDNRLALWKPSGWTPYQEKKDRYSFVPVFQVANLDECVTRLKEKEVTFLEGIREKERYHITTIVDPEQNRLQLFMSV